MGSTNSTELLEIPHLPQSPPVLATSLGRVSTKPTSFCVKHESMWRSSIKVTDVGTQQHVFNFKFPSLSTRHILQQPNGRALLTLKHGVFTSGYRVFELDKTDKESFTIRVEGGSHSIMYADFTDARSGRACRVLLNGGYNRVVIFYIEYGAPTLPPKPRLDDLTNSSQRFQAIGRIRRPKNTGDSTYVEAASGVDMTLLLLLWRAWEYEDERGRG